MMIHRSIPSPVTLSKVIAAINIRETEDGHMRMGLISQLPQGAELQICGEGFNERTIKVRWGERLYFVFVQDIEEPRPRALAVSA
jgi:hypothetical protein